MTDRQNRTLSVTVAALTRRRPKMLAALLSSFGEMVLPENCQVKCLIVENDEVERSKDIVASSTPLANGLPVDYVLETEPGIPFARNLAAREAIASGSDLLAFVDDDEFVDPNWLKELIAEYRRSDAVLIGGPVSVVAPEDDLTFMETVFLKEIGADFERRAKGADRAALKGRFGPVTNNWLGETALFADHDIWFDESLRYTGGSDARFYQHVQQKALPLGRATNAHVYATYTKDRLNFRMQWREAHSRAINRLELGQANLKNYWLRFPFSILIRLISATCLALAMPFRRGRGVLKVCDRLGTVTGRLSAAFGARSRLYTKVFGH